MPHLHPFQAVHYAEGRDLSTKIAPPYDVLDAGPKRKLLDRDAHNIVAIDLPVTPPKTVGPDAAYAEAGERYRRWRAEGVLRTEREPALYAYEQVYTVGDRLFKRRGFFGTLDVEPFNQPHGIFRHEQTIRSGTDDRFKLMTATAAQLSPVFGVFPDPNGVVRNAIAPCFESDPDFHGVTEFDGVEHRCFAIRDRETIATLVTAMKFAEVFIADGHHRYTTALNYHAEHARNERAGRCLFVLVPVEDPGMIVMPYHRVLTGLRGFDMGKLITLLKKDGRLHVTTTDHGRDDLAGLLAELPGKGRHAFGLYDAATQRTFAVSAVQSDPIADLVEGRSGAYRGLDVAVVHHLFIDALVRPAFGGEAIAYLYTHELDDLAAKAHGDAGRLGIVMQATRLQQVCDVSRANDVMPPKSTFFYPKLATGLLINPLD